MPTDGAADTSSVAVASAAPLWCDAGAGVALSSTETRSRIEACAPSNVVVRVTHAGGAWPTTAGPPLGCSSVGSVGVGRIVKCGANVVVTSAGEQSDGSAASAGQRRSLRLGALVAFVLPRTASLFDPTSASPSGGVNNNNNNNNNHSVVYGASLSSVATYVEVAAVWTAPLDEAATPTATLGCLAAGLDLVTEVALTCLTQFGLTLPAPSRSLGSTSDPSRGAGSHAAAGAADATAGLPPPRRLLVVASELTAVDDTAMALVGRVFGAEPTLLRAQHAAQHQQNSGVGAALSIASRGPFDGVLVLPTAASTTAAAARGHASVKADDLDFIARRVLADGLVLPGSTLAFVGAAPTTAEDVPAAFIATAAARGIKVGWSARDAWMMDRHSRLQPTAPQQTDSRDVATAAPPVVATAVAAPWRLALALGTAFIEQGGCTFDAALVVPCALPSALNPTAASYQANTAAALALAAEDLRALPRSLRGAGAAVVVFE